MFTSHSNLLTKEDRLSYYFWLFIIVHSLLWTIGPALLRTSLTHDTLESITWGLQWQFGYNKHPFLTAWLCAGISQLFGSIDWPVYFLAQLAVLVTFFATWKLALEMMPAAMALIAALALEGVLFYNINSFNITPDTLQSPLWALLILFFYKAVKEQHLGSWFAVGLFAALSLSTKYQIGLLLLPMLLFCIINPEARDSFKKKGIYCALSIFFLLSGPHFIWLYQHHFISLIYALKIPTEYTKTQGLLNHIEYPLRFLINNILSVLCLFILLLPFYKKNPIRHRDAFQSQFLVCLGLGPLLLTFLLCIILGANFTSRWSTPYYSTLGILFLYYLQPNLTEKNIKQFAIILFCLSSLLFVGRMSTFAFYSRPGSDAFLPNKQIASTLLKLWHEHYSDPLPFLAGSNYLVSTVMPYMADKPIPYLSWKRSASSWIKEQDLHKKGALFIWDVGGNYSWDKNSKMHSLPEKVLNRFPKLQILPKLVFYRTSDKKTVLVGVAILPPDKDYGSGNKVK